MQADRMGILSAVLASVCCLGPLLLAVLGLGSLGLGAALGRYHWWFIGAAIVLLAYAWRSYVAEAHRCRATRCQMARGRTTGAALTLASVVVATLVGLNLYTYASQRREIVESQTPLMRGPLASATIPVQGMTCFTCELTVESSLKRLPGVADADATVAGQVARVEYDPSRVSVEELVAAIDKTGYQASRPE